MFVVSALSGCTRDQAIGTSPSVRTPNETSARLVTTLGTSTLTFSGSENRPNSGGLPPFWVDLGGIPSASTGIVIPPNTTYRVIVSGSVSLAANNDYLLCNPSGTFPGVGSYGPAGTGGSWNELVTLLQLVETGGSTTILPFHQAQTGTSAPDSARTEYRYTVNGGVLYAGHAGAWGGCNNNDPNNPIVEGTYLISGERTIRVDAYTNFFKLTAVPSYVKAGTPVTFTATLDDGTLAGIWSRSWTKDPGVSASGPACSPWYANPCTSPVYGSGTMTVTTNVAGPTLTATAHVTVYSSFTLDADQTTVHPGDTVTFTPKYSGIAGPAARWRWVPDDTSSDTAACTGGESSCKQRIRGPGTMWAYTAASGGDSASKHTSVLPRRKLSLNPADSVWVASDATVDFVASAEGAALVDLQWSESILSPNAVRRVRVRSNLSQSTAPPIASSTCDSSNPSCQDVLDGEGSYTRTVSATVDDSSQTQSVVVFAIDMTGADSSDVNVGEPGNPKERLWCLQNWGVCSSARTWSDTALKYAKARADSNGVPPVNNIYDAQRHAFWQALLTREFGANIAKTIGDNHEYGELGNADPTIHASSCMDLMNNQRGREIAIANPGSTTVQLWSLVVQSTNLQPMIFSCAFTKPW